MINSVYCSAPWRGLTVREDGIVRTCCAGLTSLGDLNQTSIDQIANNHELLDIQQALVEGRPHSNCNLCRHQESENKPAPLRSHYNNHYPLTDTTSELKFLDIRWNNKCNLTCQYCNTDFSSAWQQKLQQPVSSARREYQQELLDWVLARVDQIDEIMMVGGEPMLMKQNYELLKKLPHHSNISIITNLNYELADLPCFSDLMDRPKDTLRWNISVDNTHDQMEYVRNGASWSDFYRNLKVLTQIWPHQVSINCVYSAFNFNNLDKILEFYQSCGVNKVSLLPIQGHREIDIFSMPAPIRKLAIEVLDRIHGWHQTLWGIDAELYPISGLEELRSQLRLDIVVPPVTLKEFYSKIAWYDLWTQKKFQDLWPEVLHMMQEHLS